jgi:hypothetical protein
LIDGGSGKEDREGAELPLGLSFITDFAILEIGGDRPCSGNTKTLKLETTVLPAAFWMKSSWTR